jgi:hypothetical protein
MLALIVLVVLVVYFSLVGLAVILIASPRNNLAGWVLAALLLVPAGWVGLRLSNTWSLDRELERLCSKDGGVRIFETVRLSKEHFDSDGTPFPEYRRLLSSGGQLGPDFSVEEIRKILIAGDPQLSRTEIRVTRKRDGKLMGSQVIYFRDGGGLPLPSPPSSRLCGLGPQDVGFPNTIFTKE